jgi:hypothetical protein
METVIVSGVVALISSAVTLLITHWLGLRSERKKAELQVEAEREKASRTALARDEERFDRTMILYTDARAKQERARLLTLAQFEASAILNVRPRNDERPSAARTFFVPYDVRLSIGADPDGDVQLEAGASGDVAAVHATLSCKRPQSCWLDVISQAGLLINGSLAAMGAHPLTDGDTIVLGDFVLTFRWLASAAAGRTGSQHKNDV